MRVNGAGRLPGQDTMKAKPDAQIEAVPLDSLSLDPANIRQHDERNRATIRASLTRFGPGRSIVIDGKGVVRAGNGTLDAAKSLGYDEVLVVEPKPGQLVAVRRRDWSPTEGTAYSIADNHATDQSTNDDTALADTLRALQSEDFDLDAVGYTGDEVDALIERLAGEIVSDPAGEWEGMPEFEQDAVHEVQLIVYFPNLDAKQAFSEQVGQPVNPETKFVWFPKSAKPTRQSVETMIVEQE
jgi:hypothetical protein